MSFWKSLDACRWTEMCPCRQLLSSTPRSASPFCRWAIRGMATLSCFALCGAGEGSRSSSRLGR
eukprot:12298858-Alexandrium_andersonii.AAC.1